MELSKHDLDKHIVEQLNRFGRAIKNPKNQKMIADRLHKEIKSDLVEEAFFKQMIGSKEIYKFLSDLVSQPPKILIIIEHKDKMIVEACENLKLSPEIREFKTFLKEDDQNVLAHLIEPLYSTKRISEERKREEVGKRLVPEHYKNWEKKLAWVDKNTSNIAKQLEFDIKTKLKDVVEEPRGANVCFFKGKPSTKSIFAAFSLTKKYLNIRIRTDPTTFRDPNKRVKEKIYKAWFFKTGQEREFEISTYNIEDRTYVIELIKHSYGLAK